MENEIEWADPPPSNRGWSGSHAMKAAALRARPGQWARVIASAKSASEAVRIKTGCGSWAPRGAFEATTRRNVDGTTSVYARYVGSDEATS